MKTRKFIFTMMLCLVLILVFAVGLAACNKKGAAQPTADVYYLSMKSTGFKTYANAADIPADVLLSDNDGKYSVSIALKKDDEFTVNKLGGDQKYGFSAIFSSANQLVEGENGAAKAAFDGTYAITLSEGSLTYSFTASVGGVQIVAPQSVLELGQTYQFAATVGMSDGGVTDEVSWSSSNAQIASVNASGQVTAVAVGTASIRATSTADAAKYADYAVEVKQGVVNVQSVTITPAAAQLDEGDTATLTAQITPVEADDKMVVWTSDNEGVATVSEGIVTAVAPGIAHITVRTRDGGKEATATITVRQPVQFVRTMNITVAANGAARVIPVDIRPSNATVKGYTVAVKSGEQNVEIIDNGDGTKSVRGLKEGSAALEITSEDNSDIKAQCTVTVKAEGTSLVYLKQSFVQLAIEEETDVEIVVENSSLDPSRFSWVCRDSMVATVEGSGATAKIKGVNFGTTTISVYRTEVENRTDQVLSFSVMVSEQWYFIYGVGFGDADWTDWSDYVSNKEKARKDERLLDETSVRGVYSLTRILTPDQGFQIIFPNVASYTDGIEWNKDIKWTADYFDANNSDAQYVSNTLDQFKVNTAGLYTIKLNVLGTSAKVSIKLVSLIATGTGLKVRKNMPQTLSEGGETYVDFEGTPAGSIIDPELIEWTISADDEDAKIENGAITVGEGSVSYAIPRTNKASVKLNASGTISKSFNIIIKAKYNEFEAEIAVPVLAAGSEATPVTSVEFEQEHYFKNVNDGAGGMQLTVKAAVNDDATVKTVYYSSDDEELLVNEMTGEVVASKFGTFSVKATSAEDPQISVTVPVTIYSDVYYLVGIVNDDLKWEQPEPLTHGETTLEGTPFDAYKFTDVGDHTMFELEGTFTSGTTFQIVFLGMDGNWTGALTAEYFNSEISCPQASIYESKNIRLSAKGIYKITIDMTGRTPTFSISISDYVASSLSLKSQTDNYQFNNGDDIKIKVSYEPTYLKLSDHPMKWSVDEGFEDYLDLDNIAYDAANNIATVRVLKAPASGVEEFMLYCELDDLKTAFLVTIAADGENEVKPTSIKFEKDHYYFNVNNGGEDWATTVKALVNEEADNQGVIYSISQYIKSAGSVFPATVDPSTGVVTSNRLGTFLLTAKSAADSALQATSLITFYSTDFYIFGEIGDVQTWSTIAPTQTTLSGIFADYQFNMIDEEHFVLEHRLEKMKLKPGNVDDYEYGFKVGFLGMPITQQSAIGSSVDLEASFYGKAADYLNQRDGNNRVLVTGIYRIELDLSTSKPFMTMQFLDQPPTLVEFKGENKVVKIGETLTFALNVLPLQDALDASKFNCYATGDNKSFVELSLDSETLALTVRIVDAADTLDSVVNIVVEYETAIGTLNVDVSAKHHLALAYDEDEHWYECTDEGCDEKRFVEPHTPYAGLRFDSTEHYQECTYCHAHINAGKHTIEESDSNDGAHVSCDECDFKLYDIDQNGVLTKYYGSFRSVVIPEEIDGKQVVGMATRLFYNRTELEEVTLSSRLTSIGGECFAGSGVRTAIVKAGVTYGDRVFENCAQLESVTIEDGATAITTMMFYGCSAIASAIRIPDSVLTIEGSAFAYVSAPIEWGPNPSVTSLSYRLYMGTQATIPNSVTTLIDGAFNQSKIIDIIIPDSVHDIGGDSFYACEARYIEFGAGLMEFPTGIDNCKNLETIRVKNPALNFIDNIGVKFLPRCPMIKAIYFDCTLQQWKDNVRLATDHRLENYNFEDGYLNLMFNAFGEKQVYLYSSVRPSADVDFGDIAGAWHFDEEGNIQKWSDTPVQEGDDVRTDAQVRVTLQERGTTFDRSGYDRTICDGGVIGSYTDGTACELSFEIDASEVEDFESTFYCGIYVYIGSDLMCYAAEYTRAIEFDFGDSGFVKGSWPGGATFTYKSDGYQGKFRVTISIDEDGYLTRVKIERTA